MDSVDAPPPLRYPQTPFRQLMRRRLLVQRPRHMGELPQTRQKPLLGSLPQRRSAVRTGQHEHRQLLRGLGGVLLPHRQLPLAPCGQGRAQHPGGARLTRRLPRQTHSRAQIHQRLIEIAGAVGRHHRCQRVPEPLACLRQEDIIPAAGQPRRNAQHVAVHGGNRLPKGDGQYRPRRIVPDARQRRQLTVRLRKTAAVLLNHLPRRFLQAAGAAVIPQPLPQPHELLLRQRRQRRDVRRGLHEPQEIGQRRLYPRLLEHHLRHPCAVGRDLLPPGQHPAVFVVPRQQNGGQTRQRLSALFFRAAHQLNRAA